MKKLIVTNYDNNINLTNKDIEIIYHKYFLNEVFQTGNYLVLLTNHSYQTMKNICHNYHIYYDYLICNHNTLIIDNKEHIIDKHLINNYSVLNIIHLFNQSDFTSKILCYNALGYVTRNYQEVAMIKLRTNKKIDLLTAYPFINTLLPDIEIKTGGYFHTIISKFDNKLSIESIINNINEDVETYVLSDSYEDLSLLTNYHGYTTYLNDNRLNNYPEIKHTTSLKKFLHQVKI